MTKQKVLGGCPGFYCDAPYAPVKPVAHVGEVGPLHPRLVQGAQQPAAGQGERGGGQGQPLLPGPGVPARLRGVGRAPALRRQKEALLLLLLLLLLLFLVPDLLGELDRRLAPRPPPPY